MWRALSMRAGMWPASCFLYRWGRNPLCDSLKGCGMFSTSSMLVLWITSLLLSILDSSFVLKGIPKHQLCFVGKEQPLLPLTATGAPGPRWTFTFHPIPPVSVDHWLIPKAENFAYLKFGLLTHTLIHLGLCRRQEKWSLACCAPSCWRQTASLGS